MPNIQLTYKTYKTDHVRHPKHINLSDSLELERSNRGNDNGGKGFDVNDWTVWFKLPRLSVVLSFGSFFSASISVKNSRQESHNCLLNFGVCGIFC